MSLPKKGSRNITVDGADYRWIVSPDDGYMVLVVEAASGEGQRLEKTFTYGDVPNADDRLEQTRRITPAEVSTAIAEGLALGWRPNERGLKPIRLREEAS